MPSCYYILFETRFGPVAVIWSNGENPLIDRVVLSRPDMTARQIVKILDPAPAPGHCVAADDLAGRIHDFLEGEPVDFNLHGIRLDRCPAFQKDVLHAESRIPRSAVSTYHRIACHLGKPGASRAVGNALARNPFPLIIPCHRAVRSDLTPGGFQGGSGMKRELLLMEGHRFDQSGRLTGPALYY